MRRFCFDIDGTICTNTWGDYEDAEPYFDRIDAVNELYDNGFHIIYFTARGMENVMVVFHVHMICGIHLHTINWLIGDVSLMS